MNNRVFKIVAVLSGMTLSLGIGVHMIWAERDQEKSPQIDVLDYSVDAELFPLKNELQGKAIVKFTAGQSPLDFVVFDFNANLKLKRVYFADKPPLTSEVAQVSQPVPTEDTEAPRLVRKAKKQTHPQTAKVAGKTGSPAASIPRDLNQLRFSQYSDDHTVRVDFNAPVAPSQSTSLVFEYEGALNSADNSPLEGVQVAYIGEEVSYLLAISRWFPMHGYFQDRATGTFRITVPQGYVVAMDGVAQGTQKKGNRETFTFVNERPSFPGSLSAAKYNALKTSVGPAEVTFYVRDNKRDFVTAQSEVIGKILELFSQKFGSYPGKEFKVAVIDNHSLLGYSAPGIEFLAERAFEATPNGSLLAREISYQWWQSLITPKTLQDLWLKEGFAGFSSLLYQESISSEAGFAREMKDTAVNALLHEDKSSIRNAYQLQAYSPEYNSILKSKGAYVLEMLRGVLGDEAFFKTLKDYVYNFGYKEATIGDFKALAEKAAGQPLDYFFSQWIDQNGVPKFDFEYTTYRVKDGFKVTGVVKQDLDTFKMPLEILVETDGKPEMKKIEVAGTESSFLVPCFGKPRKVKLDPNNKVLKITDDIQVAAAIARGDELRKLGQPTEAISEYQKAIELNKRSSLAFFRIGEVFFEQRSYQSAANSFREALNGDLDPKWIEVWCYINLGRVFDVLNQRERALKEYQKALDTNDNSQGAQEVAQKYVQEPFKYEGKSVLVK
jgi:tetratricopeptide (TPR) repeat protein